MVYVAVGEDPEHGEGAGPSVVHRSDQARRRQPGTGLQLEGPEDSRFRTKRLQAVEPEKGDFARPNPNSAAIWHYGASSMPNRQRVKREFEDTMHRTLGTVAIKDDILYIADYSGLFHCLDAKTGKRELDVRYARRGVGLAADRRRQSLHRRRRRRRRDLQALGRSERRDEERSAAR